MLHLLRKLMGKKVLCLPHEAMHTETLLFFVSINYRNVQV
uniref:Uncharacterized protein n=1 Tax=Arundo donax TaxID=35708 RepID=A0A0A9HQL1_ARUDO